MSANLKCRSLAVPVPPSKSFVTSVMAFVACVLAGSVASVIPIATTPPPRAHIAGRTGWRPPNAPPSPPSLALNPQVRLGAPGAAPGGSHAIAEF